MLVHTGFAAILSKPGSGALDDATPIVLAALRQAVAAKAKKLVLPTGIYHFRPRVAEEHYLFMSNNDEGLKRVAFPLFDLEDFEIDGQGSTFIFHGFISPFAIVRSKHITLRNITIDWARTFHSEGRVLAVHDDGVEMQFDAQFPYRVSHGRLTFTGEGSDVYRIGNILEFDAARRETAFMARDNYGAGERLHAEDLGGGRVRITLPFTTRPHVGNILAFQDSRRLCPAIFVADSEDVTLVDVTLHHAGGMGVIAQWTRDITLQRVRVTPPIGGGRIVSLTADATHFVNCAGKVAMTDCLFENQMDDATNVHGIYGQISSLVDAKTVEVRLVHGQQFGIDVARIDDRVELIRRDSLLTFHQTTVAAVTRINKEYYRLTFSEALPPDVTVGESVGNLSWQADVAIEGCLSRSNRARGFLLSTRGKISVQRNEFHTPGAAILIAGDANYWFESGAVRDVTIANNLFDRCNFGVWGRACIDVHPEIKPEYCGGATFYHRGLVIRENTFNIFDHRIARIDCVDGVVFNNNIVKHSSDYAPQHVAATPVQVSHCRGVSIELPTVASADVV